MIRHKIEGIMIPPYVKQFSAIICAAMICPSFTSKSLSYAPASIVFFAECDYIAGLSFQGRRDRFSDGFDCLSQRIVGQMGVPLGCLRLRVSEHFADDQERHTSASAKRRECMPEIVQPDILDPGMLSHERPWFI